MQRTVAGGANTITVSDTAASTLRFAILEYSGVATSGSLEAAAVMQGDSASPSSGGCHDHGEWRLVAGSGYLTDDGDGYTHAVPD